MLLVQYVYAGFFYFAKFISFGISYPHYRAAFISSLSLGFNILTVLSLSGLNVFYNKLVVIVGFLIWYGLHLKFFLDPRRYKAGLKILNKQSLQARTLSLLVVFIYCIGSFILFIKVQAR